MNSNELFPPAAPDFSDPLGLLRACHERVFKHCDILENLAAHIGDKGVDQDAREAAAQVHKYFSVAGKHHHQDEEQDIFPRLARQSLKLADLIHQLKQDHERLDALWDEIEPLLSRPARIEDAENFLAMAQQFADAYRAHARRENEELLEMAQHIFGSDELKQIGEKMAERRGVQVRLR
jgi:hemerythrin-like domain-containing protein